MHRIFLTLAVVSVLMATVLGVSGVVINLGPGPCVQTNCAEA